MHDQLHSILFFGEGVRNLAPIMAFLYDLSPNIRGLLYYGRFRMGKRSLCHIEPPLGFQLMLTV